MKKMFQLCFFISFLLISIAFSQDNPFESLLIQKELNPSVYLEVKKSAIIQGLPVSIKLQNGILIDVLKEENGTVLYSVIKNLANPFLDGEVLTYEQITNKFDLSDAEINWGYQSGEISQRDGAATQLLLIPDWTNDNVLSFDPVTGDLVNANYIPPNPGNLASPKHALINPNGFVGVSDQITDLVQKFDTSGNYLGIFAPAGGVNNTILDNMRGHNYRPNGNLVVTVGSGGNQNAVPEFDNGGNYLGNFITAGSGGLNSPFCIIFRTNDVLVTGSSSDAVHRYDLNGNYLDNLITGVQFPQQIIELPNGNLALAIFSTPSGLGIYNSLGTQLNFFTQVSGLRGVYQLPTGNYLVTNSTGLHEIDDTTGNLIRTIYSATNVQYISLVDYSIIPVELTSFSANVEGQNVSLFWQTASEKNNYGFEIERLQDSKITRFQDWEKIGFVNGYGTTSESKSYSFIDEKVAAGTYTYRLKQIDFDGTFQYSNEVEVNVIQPDRFSLNQNYPNPFNPSTKISYNIPANSFVKLELFSITGEKLAALVNDIQEAGYYNVILNSNKLGISSGTYFYRLTAINNSSSKKFAETKKMLLLK